MSTSEPLSSDDKWRQKYLRNLDEQEQLALNYQQNEALLCKTVVRLALAVKGLNSQLDPHLVAISSHLKKGLDSERLQQQLEDFSQCLMHQQDTDEVSELHDAALLFDFLRQQFQQENEIIAINRIAQQYRDHHYQDVATLYTDLAASCHLTPTSTTTSSANTDADSSAIDITHLCKLLLQLLDNIEIPPQLEGKFQPLTKKLQNNVGYSELSGVLDDSIDLLVNAKKINQREQKALEDFLSNITEQLTDLGNMAIGTDSMTQKQAIDRDQLESSVSEQMQQLRLHSADATKLEPLKNLISTHLTSISQQLLEYQNEEKQRQQETRQQLSEMTEKISRMETESTELKSRLAIAHDQALRDPLTALPNRLAFDERIQSEIARWNRYKLPLSILIWDIDHFKKINDQYGHKSGDKTLQLIAGLLTKNCRQTDFVARFGGEEFVMLFPSTQIQAAKEHADDIRNIVARTGFKANNEAIQITLSCGISQFQEQDSFDAVFERADQALYQAKESGRNCCVAL